MEQVYKEYYCLANFFYNSYLKDDKEMEELINSVNRGIRNKFSESIIAECLGTAKVKLDNIEASMKKIEKDTDANPWILCLGFIFLLWEHNVLSMSQRMTVKRLGNEIYSRIEKDHQMDVGFRNANKIVSKYESYKG